MQVYEADVLVIGSEGAGARAAIEAAAAGLKVIVVTKGPLNRTGATLTASADIDVDSRSCKDLLGLPGNPEDTLEQYFEDTIVGGKYINDQTLVEALVTEIPERMVEMVQWGLKLKDLIRTPGHRYPRGVVAEGLEFTRVLARQMRKYPNIQIVEYCMVLELLKADGRIAGATGLQFSTGEFLTFHASAVVLATGGGMALYPNRTAPDELTGDGHAMAFRAGAEAIAMEMTQFMPCVFLNPPAWKGLQFVYEITPGSTEGLAGWFLNRAGDRFMSRHDPERMEKSTRDIIARAIATEVREGRGSPSGGVYYSIAHLPKNLIDNFPTWYPYLHKGWTYEHFDFGELIEWMKQGNACEISIGSHFFMGGMRGDVDGATGVPGLFVGGEVQGGVHGANRLSGNALTQVLVQGYRAGRAAASYAAENGRAPLPREQADQVVAWATTFLDRKPEVGVAEMRASISDLAWKQVGPVRTGAKLEEALVELTQLEARIERVGLRSSERIYNREWVESLQLRNQVQLARMIAVSALKRTESRGAHYREEIPNPDEHWKTLNVVVRNQGGQMVADTIPVPVIGSLSKV
jgi:succinate dehydrogenase/fumarate reductase flavoprotein subunit